MAVRVEDTGTAPARTAGLTGPADTADASVRVSTTTPSPGEVARTVGTVNGAAPMTTDAQQERDESSDRFEIYETTLPDGRSQWMRRNLETGMTEKVDSQLAEQDRAARAEQAAADAVDAAEQVAAAAGAAVARATRRAQEAADRARNLSSATVGNLGV